MSTKHMAHPAFKFGDIVGNDQAPGLRAMIIGLNRKPFGPGPTNVVYYRAVVVGGIEGEWQAGHELDLLMPTYWQKVEDPDGNTK